MVNLASFVGGATDGALLSSPEADLVRQAEAEVARVLNISGEPVTRASRIVARALPQYNLGHSEIVAGLEQELARHPGLFLAGNYLAGASIGSCTEHSSKVAEAVKAFLSRHESA
jgi:oxygen-dependent protoporphyrinogen oxidase